jgi:Predicted acetyltransferase
MWKVTNENYKYVERVLQKKKEKNIYILGDIAQYGLDSEQVECFAGGKLECPEYVLLRFCNSYVVYMPDPDIGLEELGIFFQEKEIRCISGENITIEKIAKIFPHSYIVNNKMLKLSGQQSDIGEHFKDEKIRLISEESLRDIQKFYCEIDEFSEKMRGDIGISKLKEQFYNGKIYGLFHTEKLLAAAALSAETESFAMVDNVATAKGFRKKGLGYRLLKRICYQELTKNKKDFLCICCSDRNAENLYKKVGFQEIGTYSMLYVK